MELGGGGAGVAQSVKHLTLDFGYGHDLTVGATEPGVRLCAGGAEPAWESLSLSLCAPPPPNKKNRWMDGK